MAALTPAKSGASYLSSLATKKPAATLATPAPAAASAAAMADLGAPTVIGQGLPPRVAGAQPPVVTIYGPTKVGKSTILAKLLCNGMFVCRPGGMLPAASYLGLSEKWGVPPVHRRILVGNQEQDWTGYLFEWHVRSVDEIGELITVAPTLGFSGLGIDDLTLDAETQAVDLDARKMSMGAKFRLIGTTNLSLREAVRYAGLMIGISAHVRAPLPQPNGRGGTELLKGGPMFPMKKLGSAFSAESDMIFYTRRDPTREGWNAVFDRTDIEYDAGDRLSASPVIGPPNLRALLVQAGHTISRFPTLEWQDEVMVAVRDRILSGAARTPVITETYTALLKAGLAPPHIRWAIEDGLDLAEIALYEHERFLNDFFLAPAALPQAMAAMTLGKPLTAAVAHTDDEAVDE